MLINQILKEIKRFISIDSLLLTIIYTIGHMIIAIVCVMAITGATLELALADAFIEPIINGVWFFILHTGYQKYTQTKQVKV